MGSGSPILFFPRSRFRLPECNRVYTHRRFGKLYTYYEKRNGPVTARGNGTWVMVLINVQRQFLLATVFYNLVHVTRYDFVCKSFALDKRIKRIKKKKFKNIVSLLYVHVVNTVGVTIPQYHSV